MYIETWRPEEGWCRRQTEEKGFEGGMSTATNAAEPSSKVTGEMADSVQGPGELGQGKDSSHSRGVVGQVS